ncbi:MAG: hypothetical protein UT48_C0026G0005 [Parcubacteria group bacterium GW2011_GWE2_39_37]|nr:MAG: hypothetical protein UT48_C0026G0005 [Parcubacteria group bacterium GW2011_GWE2_39_37]
MQIKKRSGKNQKGAIMPDIKRKYVLFPPHDPSLQMEATLEEAKKKADEKPGTQVWEHGEALVYTSVSKKADVSEEPHRHEVPAYKRQHIA